MLRAMLLEPGAICQVILCNNIEELIDETWR